MSLNPKTRLRPTATAARWSAVSFLLLVALVLLVEWQRSGSRTSTVSNTDSSSSSPSQSPPGTEGTATAADNVTTRKPKPAAPAKEVAQARPRSTPPGVQQPPVARTKVPAAEGTVSSQTTTNNDTSVASSAPATNLKRSPKQPPSAPRAPPGVADDPLIIRDQTIRDQQGRVTYRGHIDLRPTLERIERGEAFPHRNDGAVFRNRERRLPQRDPDYYREYVHPTPDVDGPGPQRIVIGREGERYFTHDHYKTFKKLPPADPVSQP